MSRTTYRPSRRLVAAGGFCLPAATMVATHAAQAQTAPLPPLTGSVNVKTFGAVGDGRADDTAAIQAAIDYALRNRLQVVHLPEGHYRTTDTLHLGYGFTGAGVSEYTTINLEGQPRANFADATVGAVLLPQRIDRPAINIQGGRNCRIAGLGITGRFQQAFINKFATYDAVLPPDRTRWLDAANIPGGLARYAPYAAVTIDAYSGPRRPDSYPAVTYPDWLGTNVPQYNKAFSSDCVIEHCYIEGFAVGIANQPAQVDGNADFTKVRHNLFGFCIHAIAICNGQSRNVEVRNNSFLACHTFLTNGYFGAAAGHIEGPIENNSGSRTYQIIDVPNAGFVGNMEFRAIYAEELTRIGVWAVGGSARAGRCTFSNCHFHFMHTAVPRALLECGTTTAPVFLSCMFMNIRRMPHLVWGGHGVIVESCVWDAGRDYTAQDPRGSTPKSDAIAKAYTYFGGLFTQHSGLVDRLELRGVSEGIAFAFSAPWALNAKQFAAELHKDGYRSTVTDHPGARWLIDSMQRRWPILWRPVPQVLPKHPSNFPRHPEQDGMLLTGAYHANQQTNAGLSLVMEPGDILYDQGNGSIFIVVSVSLDPRSGHYDFTAELHNNYNRVDDTRTPASVIDRERGHLVLVKTGIVVPTTIYWGDFTAGSTEVQKVHRGDGRAQELSRDIPIGMWIGADDSYAADAGNAVSANTRVTSVSGSLGVVRLSRPAAATGRFPILPIRIART